MPRTLWALAAALAAALAVTVPALAADVEPLLADDTEMVVSVNLKQLLDAPLVKKYALEEMKKSLQGSAEASKTLADLGIDPFTSVDRVTLGSGGTKPEQALVVLRGNFDPARFAEKARALAKEPNAKLKVLPGDGPAVVEFPAGNSPLFVAAASNTALIVAPRPEGVRAALARAAAGKPPTLKKDVADLLARADAAQTVYLVGLTAGAASKVPLDDEALKQTLEKIRSIAGGLAVAADLKVTLEFGLKDAAAAKDFAKLLDDGVVFLKGFAPQLAARNPKMGLVVDLLNTIKTDPRGAAVTLAGSVPAEAFEKALK
jgi:hypothetical protein